MTFCKISKATCKSTANDVSSRPEVIAVGMRGAISSRRMTAIAFAPNGCCQSSRSSISSSGRRASAVCLSTNDTSCARKTRCRFWRRSKPGFMQISLRCCPKSALSKVIGYMLGQWSKLEKYVTDGRFEISKTRSLSCFRKTDARRNLERDLVSVSRGLVIRHSPLFPLNHSRTFLLPRFSSAGGVSSLSENFAQSKCPDRDCHSASISN